MYKWLLLMGLLFSAAADAAVELGKDYEMLANPRPVTDKTRIEVIEFFQYACIHCSSLEPILSEWAKTMPAYVDFKRVHVVWQNSMEGAARFFATEVATKTSRKLHYLAFEAVLDKHINLEKEASWVAWLKTVPDIDVSSFMKIYHSFDTRLQVARAAQLTRDYSVQGTPMVVIAGKYVVRPRRKEESGRFVAVMNELIDKVRKEQTNKKSPSNN